MKRIKIKRKGEKWVSNNRVLLGSSKKDPGRNPNFDTEETKLLISLWGDPTIQRTLITTHRKHTVIAKLADKMSEYGYSRSAEEINTRIKNLKCFYNRLKKDIQMGMITGPTWKHYSAMDEIMTRSIFSVRPNEIPKPSLKYQMELEMEERKKLKAETISVLDESLSDNVNPLEENASCSSHSSKDELMDDGHLNSDESAIMDFIENTDNLIKIKEEEGSDTYITDMEEVPLIIPKDETVDDDVEVQPLNTEENKNPESQTPTRLTEYITLSNNNSNSIALTSTCHTTVNSNCNTIITTSQPTTVKTTMPQSIVFSNQPKAISSSQGKISLVPTNFLMQQNNKTQPQQIQIRPQPQQRIICAQQNNQVNTGIVQSGGAGRMKVLLVNAFQNGKTQNVATPKEPSFSNSNHINTTNTNQKDSGITINYTEPPKPTRTEEPVSSKDPGMEMLFNKLIVMQSENNEIQKQRLEIERQRLEFEKSIAGKLLEVLSSLKPVQSQDYIAKKKNESSENCVREKAPIPDIIDEFNTFHLLTPKVEKID